MSDEKKEISKAPPPIEPLSGSSSPPLIWHKPDWNFWKHKTKIKLWEAAFLCCDIDSRNQGYRDIKGRHYEKVAIYLDLLKDNLNRLDFDFVNLPEVVEWALSKDLDILKELAALAKKPNIQDESSTPNRKQTRINENRAFLLDCLEQGVSHNIASIWQHIIAHAGEPNFLFKTASKLTATLIDGKQVERKNLSRQLDRIPKK